MEGISNVPYFFREDSMALPEAAVLRGESVGCRLQLSNVLLQLVRVVPCDLNLTLKRKKNLANPGLG